MMDVASAKDIRVTIDGCLQNGVIGWIG